MAPKQPPPPWSPPFSTHWSWRGDGFAYDPITKVWEALPPAPIAARDAHAAVWATTAKLMIVWGGRDGGSTFFADGATYDHSTRTWTMLPPAPISARVVSSALWTGSEMLVWGGRGSGDAVYGDGALYNPVTKTWRTRSAPPVANRIAYCQMTTSAQFAFFGGFTIPGTVLQMDGAMANIAAVPPTWKSIAAPSAALLASRAYSQCWYADDKLTVWSGLSVADSSFTATGATYDTKASTWSKFDAPGAPVPRALALTTWTGKAALVWGGSGKPGGGAIEYLNTGAIYVP